MALSELGLVMSNGARHALGAVAGLFLPPLIALGAIYGVGQVVFGFQAFKISWLGLAVLVGTAVLLAFLLGSRISPVASLMGGLGFTAIGLIPSLEVSGLSVLPRNLLSGELGPGFMTLLYSGLFLLLGVTMLTVSAFPSRWRARRPAEPAVPPAFGAAPPYRQTSVFQPPPQAAPGDVTRPMHRE